MGMIFSRRDWDTGKDRGNSEWSLNENLLQSENDLRMGTKMYVPTGK
jgi:hypothetical protein